MIFDLTNLSKVSIDEILKKCDPITDFKFNSTETKEDIENLIVFPVLKTLFKENFFVTSSILKSRSHAIHHQLNKYNGVKASQ